MVGEDIGANQFTREYAHVVQRKTETAVMILMFWVSLAIFTANCNGAGIIRMLIK